MYIEHPWIVPETIERRDYQENIAKTALKKNTLCVLPTGMGKTNIAILVAAERIDQFPEKKILIMAPTRPLCSQHQKSFEKYLDIKKKDISLITGQVIPENRRFLYGKSKVIIATPQTIRNDIKNKMIFINNFSLLIFDECHRAVKDYAYTYVARRYKQSPDHLILGLTASPGSSEQKIKHICNNLGIENVEIRTEHDEDVKKYMKEIETEYIKLDLPEELKKIQSVLKDAIEIRMKKLKEHNIHARSKSELLEAQKKLSDKIKTEKNPIYYHLVASTAEVIKIWYVLELLETQSIEATRKYIEKIMNKKTASDRRIAKDPKILKVFSSLETYHGEHPKMEKIREIVEENKKLQIILFSHFRNNIEKIYDTLKKIEGCNPAVLIGQRGDRGLSQKQQIEIVRDYEDGVYNCLITSPIGEEGLHLASADLAIFYDSVPSEIRTIQRRGRVGRTKVGKIIFLLTKNTRDETYYWVANRKEKKMKQILKDMQRKNLNDFV